MKRLAILSSLALLISPCFNAANGSGLNQGRVFNAAAEGGDSASEIVDGYQKSVGAITFGDTKTTGSKALTEDRLKKACDGISPSLDTDNSDKYYDDGDGYALKLGSKDTSGKLCFSFKSPLIISDVTVTAAGFNTKGVKLTATSDNDSSEWSLNKSTDFDSHAFTNLDGGQKKKTASFSLTTSKQTSGDFRVFISKIEFTIWAKVASETPVVTYDYGEVADLEGYDLLSSETLKSGDKITNTIADGTVIKKDWTTSYKFQGWYTDEDKTEKFDVTTSVTNDIKLYAKWETDELDAYTSIKNSETKAQLNYKYSTIYVTGKTSTLSFGETESSNIDEVAKNTEIKFADDGGSSATVDSATKCYWKESYALKFSSGRADGSIKLTFNPVVSAKKIKIYAKKWDGDSPSLSLTLNNDSSTLSKQGIDSASFKAYEFSGFSVGEISSITIAATKRFYVSKIEFVSETESESGEAKVKVSDIGMRFGALLSAKDYKSVVAAGGNITNYGVACAVSLPTGYTSITEAAKAEKLDTDESSTSNFSWSKTTEECPLSNYVQTINGAEYYVFNTYIGVKEASITTSVYAVGFVTLDTGETLYFSEKTASVKSLAQEYIDSKEYDGVIAETLGYLAEGKISA